MLRRFFEDRRIILALSLLGVISLMLLAGALNRVSFEPARPLYREEAAPSEGGFTLAETLETFAAAPLWQQISFFASFALILMMTFFLMTPEMRKRLFRMFVRGALAILLIFFLLKERPEIFEGIFPLFNFEDNGSTALSAEGVAPPIFNPPQVSETFSFFIAFIVVLIFSIVVWRVYAWWLKQNAELHATRPLDEIAKVARRSLDELSRQGASRDAIIRCYENMSHAVFERRGLQRNYAMTAAEFAQKLEKAGLPREPVERLTRLFESARYGSHASTQGEIDEAVLCLSSIVKYCGEKV